VTRRRGDAAAVWRGSGEMWRRGAERSSPESVAYLRFIGRKLHQGSKDYTSVHVRLSRIFDLNRMNHTKTGCLPPRCENLPLLACDVLHHPPNTTLRGAFPATRWLIQIHVPRQFTRAGGLKLPASSLSIESFAAAGRRGGGESRQRRNGAGPMRLLPGHRSRARLAGPVRAAGQQSRRRRRHA
jgi:hypothetical protein